MTIREALEDLVRRMTGVRPEGSEVWEEEGISSALSTINKIIAEKVEMAVRAREDDLPTRDEMFTEMDLRTDGCEQRIGTIEWLEMLADIIDGMIRLKNVAFLKARKKK